MSGQDINLSTENAILMFSCHSRTTAGCKVCGVAIRTHRSSPSCATRSCQYAGLEPDVTLFRQALKAGLGRRSVLRNLSRARSSAFAMSGIVSVFARCSADQTRPCRGVDLSPDVTLFQTCLESRVGSAFRVAQSESHTELRLCTMISGPTQRRGFARDVTN